MAEPLVIEFEREGQKEKVLTRNREMIKLLQMIFGIKDSEDPILFTGETGVGKDLLTRAVHYTSKRQNRRLVVVTLPALPDTLVESELFGVRKGAFTGASQDTGGLIREAEGGTLYLNEISDISPTVQVKLNKLVEDKEYRRVGENRSRKVNIRVVAATNGNLQELISQGRFRKDLYYRLKVFEFYLPPLRERSEDIPILVDYFLKKYSAEKIITLDPQIINIFSAYHWPGNIRELENHIKSLIPFVPADGYVSLDYFQKNFDSAEFPSEARQKTLPEILRDVKKKYILQALEECHGVKSDAAKKLGIPEATLRWWMKKLGITYDQKKTT